MNGIKRFYAKAVMTKGKFLLNSDKSLQIHVFYVQCQAKMDFLKNVKAQ